MQILRYVHPPRIAALLGVTLCLTISCTYLLPRLVQWNVLPDFTVFWAAGRLSLERPQDIYDASAITWAQAWATSPSNGPRLFPYPPTALILVVPFGLLPFWIAYWSWMAVSVALFWSAARRVVDGWAVPLSLVTPHAVLVLILGQTTLVVGSALIWSLSLLRARPLIAGLLMGAAAAVKPQSFLLAPVALLSGRHWQAMTGAAAGFAGMVAASLVLGPGLWLEWASSLTAFPAALEGLHNFGATPWMAGRSLGLDALGLSLLQLAGVAAGAWIVWHGFRQVDLQVRLFAFVAGCLLASPYAMRYELAVLGPVLVAALLSGSARGLLTAVPLFALHAVTIVPTLLIASIATIRGRGGFMPLSLLELRSTRHPV